MWPAEHSRERGTWGAPVRELSPTPQPQDGPPQLPWARLPPRPCVCIRVAVCSVPHRTTKRGDTGVDEGRRGERAAEGVGARSEQPGGAWSSHPNRRAASAAKNGQTPQRLSVLGDAGPLHPHTRQRRVCSRHYHLAPSPTAQCLSQFSEQLQNQPRVLQRSW